jgi:hypothetical protein
MVSIMQLFLCSNNCTHYFKLKMVSKGFRIDRRNVVRSVRSEVRHNYGNCDAQTQSAIRKRLRSLVGGMTFIQKTNTTAVRAFDFDDWIIDLV